MSYIHSIYKSQNGWSCKAHWEIILHRAVSPSILPRTMFSWVLNISRGGDSVGSLGSLFQCLSTLTGNTLSLFSLCLILQISACAHCCFSFHWLSLIEVYFHLHLSLSVQVFICRIYSVSRYCSKSKDQHGFTYAFSLSIYTHPWKG